MNSYFVCLTISRRYISFEYYQEGASKPLAPFPAEEAWPVPLSLYCTPSKIEIGHAAQRAAARGVPGAFKDWFQHLSSGETVSYLGQQQPINHLLLLAAEEQLRTFLKDVRYNRDGGLENCRAALPLVLAFEDDVDDSMRIFLVNLFKSNGYGRVYELFHNRSIASHHGSIIPSDYMLIVDSDGIDLTLSLYERGRDEEKLKRVLLNAGMDPRLQSLCNMIWDKTGAEYSFLDRKAEQPRLEQMAADIISANQIEYEGTMNYSNGERMSFIVSRSELIASASGNRSIAADVIQFLDKDAGVRPKEVTVVLKNFATKSDYFAQALSAEFPSLILHEEEAVEGANKIIVTEVIPWLKAGKEQPTISQTAAKEERPTPPEPPVGTIPPPPPQPAIDPKALMKMGRDMRAARANIKAKFERGDKIAASQAYKELIASWGNAAPAQLLSELHDWLAEKGITRDALLNAIEQPKPIKPKRPEPVAPTAPKPNAPKNPPVREESKPESNEMTEGERLLKKGEFAEAKRFFAGVGNERMKQLCIDLLRDSRDLKAMTCQSLSSLSPTARKNNLDKLKRILTNYRKAGLPTDQIEDLIRKLK